MGSTPARARRTHPLTLLIVLLTLSLVLGLTWLLTVQRQSESSQQALETVRVRSTRIYNLDVLLLRMFDAEAAVGIYLLTGNPVHLQPFHDAPGQIESALHALRAESNPQRPAHQTIERLGTLIDARMQLLQHNVDAGRMADAAEPDGGPGKQLTDQIRTLLLELRERTLADSSAAQEEAFARFGDVRAMNGVLGAGVLVLLLVLALALFREDRLRRQIAGILSSENERLQAEVEARTADLSRLANYLTWMRESDQARVASELHDELGILLSAARMDAGALARRLPADAESALRTRLTRLIDTIARAISAKRKLVAELRPPLLADFGAVEALRALAHGALDAGTELELDLPESLPALDAQVSLALYRTAQEALTNVRLHARASHVKLALQHHEDRIVLRVEDDGIGFEPAGHDALRMGLAQVAHRVRMLGGHVHVRSSPQHGTTVEAQLPMTPA